MLHTDVTQIVTSEEQLRELLGQPSENVSNKTISIIDTHVKEFISLSPFLTISTADRQGNCDCSPRGDSPGFVHVLDEKHLIIPERPGNKRADSLRNIVQNPKVGLLFMIPSLEETLRINGEACISTDENLLTPMAVQDRIPLLGIIVKVEECFLHCAKALKRSQLWKGDTWPVKESLPYSPKILADHIKLPGVDEESIKQSLHESYTKRLY
ncbi:pyridoxamine 5'-phosphate oxidase family protein [Cytobacillus spongiae]|jgi:PPOX class probable FMN-dependent enzyme|uniref:pyridoxamine 5'-phosphate oxidase family protein n=1 Tax=Cytobacillus spongiae TaxID=2901381 RepID=UPI001F36E549|nr:pyridoxamine 5'-phosphate oxidase family protein [Cytobacillus spongiae]UII56173.1 pyridoxamine 5'-phosphate oxidase family protein [Cytobacillus spongiae]